MIVGFTGTRTGMSEEQRDQFCLMLACFRSKNMNVFHYGAHADVELKADVEAATIAGGEMGFELEPHCASRGGELVRNRDIVAAVDVLIAAPLVDKEELRSGTWATIRYARAARKPVVMLSRGGR